MEIIWLYIPQYRSCFFDSLKTFSGLSLLLWQNRIEIVPVLILTIQLL